MSAIRWKKEIYLTLGLILFGLAVLPFLVFIVGQQVVGEYEGDFGSSSLYAAIFESLARGEIPTFLLVLSPWLVVYLFRLLARLFRSRRTVNPVTD